MPVLDTKKIRMFKLLKEFLDFEEEIEESSSCMSSHSGGSTLNASASEWVSVVKTSPKPSQEPRKIDYTFVMGILLKKMCPLTQQGQSKHPQLVWLFKSLYEDFPERFKVVGELHADTDSRPYFSFSYQKDGERPINFHAYGKLAYDKGTRFMMSSLNIYMGKESYEDAAVFV